MINKIMLFGQKPIWRMVVLGVIGFVGAQNVGISQNNGGVPPSPPGTSQPNVQRELKRLEDSVSEIRRDQLNYRLERDLLKDAYTSNFQTVQLVVTIVLGAFAILGYLGMRSIGTLRSDFQRELDQFRTARAELERQIAQMQREQAEAKTAVEKLNVENETHDRRLRGLELREKVQSLIHARAYLPAIDYLHVGLQLIPDDSIMLRQKAQCLTRLGRLAEASSALESGLKANPEDPSTVLDLAENYLMGGQLAKYQAIAERSREIAAERSPYLSWYFEAFVRLLQDDLPALKEHARELLAMKDLTASAKIAGGWSFEEARVCLAARPHTGGQALFGLLLDFLEGRIDGKALEVALAGSNA